MIVSRDADSHLRCALPFIRQGMPVFVDKPFAQKAEDARAMEQAAQQAGSILTGGSTCRYIPAVERVCCALSAQKKAPVSVLMSFEADRDSPYGGLAFYGSHLVDMFLAIFGCHWQRVQTESLAHVTVAAVQYPEFTVTLQFVKNNPQNHIVLDFGSHMICEDLDISQCYPLGMRAFANILRGRQSAPPPPFFSASVVLMDAIQKQAAEALDSYAAKS